MRAESTSRGLTCWLGCVAVAMALLLPFAGRVAAENAAPITIVINQSPWFAGFEKLIEYYESETGNEVTLDANPFDGAVEKQRNSMRAGEGIFDVLIMNGGFLPEFYASGFVQPLNEIDPGFKLDPDIFRYADTVCWDEQKKAFDCESGELMGVPINPNINVLFYREDLYEANGLEVPRTMEELLANAKALQDPPRMLGIIQPGQAGDVSTTYHFLPVLRGFGADIFRDPKNGDYTVTLNSPEARRALDFYLELAKEAGHPRPASVGSEEEAQWMVTGKVAHLIDVIAEWGVVEDPDRSAVVGKFNVAVVPGSAYGDPSPTLAHFIDGVPRNVPMERKLAALEFFKWFQTHDAQMKYTEFGAVPVRKDVYESDLADQPRYRWLKGMAESSPYTVVWWSIPEGAQIIPITSLAIHQALAGELSSAEALNGASAEIEKIMARAGYKTGLLPNLE